MTTDISNAYSRARLASLYRETLLNDVMPFWLHHGLDREHGGMITALDRDGSLLDTDKSVWFRGERDGCSERFTTLSNPGRNGSMRHDRVSSFRANIASPRPEKCISPSPVTANR
jgi:hypothetical protein